MGISQNHINEAVGSSALHTITLEAQSELLRRITNKALEFTFRWRGVTFHGRLESGDGKTRLTLFAELGVVPYSTENRSRRRTMLAVVDTLSGQQHGRIRLVTNQTLIHENEIEIPTSSGCTANNIIASVTRLVLETAPYLDAVAELTLTEPAHA